MSLLTLAHVRKAYGSKTLFEDLTFTVNRGEKIGFIGGNGTGKTTLFRLIAGLEATDAGEITPAREARIGYVAQEMQAAGGGTVYEEVARPFGELFALRERLRDLEHRLAEAGGSGDALGKLLDQYDRLSERCTREGAWDFEYRIEWVLRGLSIPEADWSRPVASFSGGEKNRIALARELVASPDILLLDEPENHLDFEGTAWLEEFIRGYEKTIVIISHNRYLLDMAVDRIWSLENRRIEPFTGNYSAFRLHFLEESMRRRKEYDQNRKKIERLEFTIRRLKAWGQVYDNPALAKKAKAMERRKERLEEESERQRLDTRKISLRFRDVEPAGDLVLRVDGYEKRFGERILFRPSGFEITRGQRVALLGPNGSGKTTLLSDIVGAAHWENPVLRLGKSVTVGYYSQMHDTLDPRDTLLSAMREIVKGVEARAKAILRGFLFRDDEFDKGVSALSGGEKARLQLARLLETSCNFLILDEPTNHLDIAAREVVEEALEEYPGSILVVSHDRYFLDRLVDRMVVIDDAALAPFTGNFSAWWERRRLAEFESRRAAERRRDVAGRPAGPTDAERKVLEIEREIEGLEGRKQELEFAMARNLNERGKHRAVDDLRELKQVTAKLELLYRRWEELAERV